MNLFGPQSRAVALAGVLLGAMAMPAMAAQADIDLLKQYIGDFKGTGQLTGTDREPETVVCRMAFADGTEQKINFAGRCSLAGQQLSVKGTIAYIDAAHHYEAAMSSNVGFTGLAVGVKKGDTIVFDLHEKTKDDSGSDLQTASTITLHDGKMDVDFSVEFLSTGQKLAAQIPFTK